MIVLADIGRAFTVLFLVAVIVMAWVALRHFHGKMDRKSPDYRRVLHIRKVALSHVGAMVLVTVDVVLRFGERPTFRLPFALTFSALTFSALVDLSSYQRRKITGRRHDDPR